MPNGVMTGSGTQTDPWIVEDGWDLDSLRNLPANQWQWIELSNDINLSIFPNWTPIPSRRFNINGRNHTIKGLRITGASSVATGLFAQLETLETKDIRIEAEIVQPSTGSSEIGILCGRLIGGHFGPLTSDPPRTAIVSNIQCFGNITSVVTGSTQPTGGCFGSTWGESNLTLHIVNCAFYGSISCHITAASTTAPSSTQLRALGGIMGFAEARGSTINYTLNIVNCISVAQFIMVGGSAPALVGGILGATRSGHTPNITGCVAKCKVLITNEHHWTQPIWFGGIFGVGVIACNISLCAAHVQVIYDPVADVATLHIAGLHCMRPSGTNPIVTSYAVIKFQNPNNTPLPTNRSIRGIGGQVVVTNSFFDSQILAMGWTEDVANSEWGRTTAQLQSQAFLESQGWVFASG